VDSQLPEDEAVRYRSTRMPTRNSEFIATFWRMWIWAMKIGQRTYPCGSPAVDSQTDC